MWFSTLTWIFKAKMQIIARQRDKLERLTIVSELTVYNPEIFFRRDRE